MEEIDGDVPLEKGLVDALEGFAQVVDPTVWPSPVKVCWPPTMWESGL